MNADLKHRCRSSVTVRREVECKRLTLSFTIQIQLVVRSENQIVVDRIYYVANKLGLGSNGAKLPLLRVGNRADADCLDRAGLRGSIHSGNAEIGRIVLALDRDDVLCFIQRSDFPEETIGILRRGILIFLADQHDVRISVNSASLQIALMPAGIDMDIVIIRVVLRLGKGKYKLIVPDHCGSCAEVYRRIIRRTGFCLRINEIATVLDALELKGVDRIGHAVAVFGIGARVCSKL